MATNYNDERLAQVEAEKQAAINEINTTYDSMINQSDGYYQAQIDASKQWADKQTQLQNEQTDFAIEQIEQQKEQEKKEYTREQSGAYVDWRKQSNEYGAKAEEMAASGLTNTGYSESSQVSMYNTYQNRVSTARESYNLAIQNYNNAITEARLQNNSILAEIAYTALQQQLELSLQGFQYKNQLISEKLGAKNSVSSEYWGRYTDVLNQINTENALAEEIRQYNASLAEEQRKFDESMAWEKEKNQIAINMEKYGIDQETAMRLKELQENSRQFNAEIEEERRQYNETLAATKEQNSIENELARRQLEASLANAKATTTSKGASTSTIKANTAAKIKNLDSNNNNVAQSAMPTTYKSAVDYLEAHGVAPAVAVSLMDEKEYKQRKASGSNTNYIKNTKNYAEYLKMYIQYAISG